MNRLGKRGLQEGIESEDLEITVEGDLAVVIVEGEEVEAVKIEEGDDLVQVVEEIQIDYLEGKLGKGRMLESKLAMNTLMKACRSVGFRVSEKVS